MKSAFAAAALLLSASAANAAPDDEYRIIAGLESYLSTNIEYGPCSALNICFGNASLIGIDVNFYSALLQSKKDGSLVQCQYALLSGPPEEKNMRADIFIGSVSSAGKTPLTTADAFRPAPGGTNTVLGSCLPYETILPDLQPSSIPNTLQHVNILHKDQEEPLLSASMSIINDPAREERLMRKYARGNMMNAPSPFRLMNESTGKHPGIKTGGSACENTGDYETARLIMRAQENGTNEVSGLKLRANCPDLK